MKVSASGNAEAAKAGAEWDSNGVAPGRRPGPCSAAPAIRVALAHVPESAVRALKVLSACTALAPGCHLEQTNIDTILIFSLMVISSAGPLTALLITFASCIL